MKIYHIIIFLLVLAITPISESKILDAVNANFEVKDDSDNPLENALIIIQGITDQNFNQQLLTDADGSASTNLNKNEIFVYTIYKFTYETKSDGFFTNSDKTIQVQLNKIPENHWYFYYINNGELELAFKSLDSDTNYSAGENINEIININNLVENNIDLMEERLSSSILDASSLKKLRWFGNLELYNIFLDITLKKDGWIKAMISNESLEVCAGNVVGVYKDQPFDVSGEEFICKTEYVGNKIPEWILKNDYKFFINVSYNIDDQDKNINLLTQNFSIFNTEWKPSIDSIPITDLNVNEDWAYNITPKYPERFVYYSLQKSPNNMMMDKIHGLASWKPDLGGFYDIIARAYYPYFDDDPRMAYTDQKFTLNVIDPKNNLYADKLEIFNKNGKVNEEVKASFVVNNYDSKKNSFNYKILTDSTNSFSYRINNLNPYSKRTIYTSWKYNKAGIFYPKLIIDSDNEVSESDETDNNKNFSKVTISSGGGVQE